MTRACTTIDELRDALAAYPAPVIVYCKSHSGSRLLARLMMAGGIWLGDMRNDSEDSADVLRLVTPLVERHFPDFSRLFREGDADLIATAQSVFAEHLRGWPEGRAWGWKLCETGYALPLLQAIFPRAHFVHLLRDGRDVAFCDHVAPDTPFWQKVYFGTDQVSCWRGRKLNWRAYRRAPHLFNAQHWRHSVTVGRAFGSMAGTRYHELRYEDLIASPIPVMLGLFAALDVPCDESAMRGVAASVHDRSLGKHRARPLRQQRQVLRVLGPALQAFGYAPTHHPTRWEQLRERFGAS